MGEATSLGADLEQGYYGWYHFNFTVGTEYFKYAYASKHFLHDNIFYPNTV